MDATFVREGSPSMPPGVMAEDDFVRMHAGDLASPAGFNAQVLVEDAVPAAGAARREPGASMMWSALGETTGQRFDDYLIADPAQRPQALRRLMLALELRWRMTEQVLVPALKSASPAGSLPSHFEVFEGSGSDATLIEITEETEHLRELASLVSEGHLSPAASIVVTGALEGLSTLVATQLGRVLLTAEQGRRGDDVALGEAMRESLTSWGETTSNNSN